MPTRTLARRTLLRGLAGAAVALPSLEAMETAGRRKRAHAATSNRFVLSFGGISTGAYQARDQLVPDKLGPDYDVKRALAPLTSLAIREHVQVVTGLEIPWAAGDTTPPPGGRSRFFHFNTTGPQVAGTATARDRNGVPRGPTADQLVADLLAGDTRHRLLAYRVQPAAEVSYAGRLSWRLDKGTLSPVDPIHSPRLAYQSLFSDFTAPNPDSAAAKTAALRLRQRKSVLDLVMGETDRLMRSLGQTDRVRMQQHLEEIRALERRLGDLPAADAAPMACRKPDAFPPDPPISPGLNWGYSDEEKRGDLMTDLIAFAFACDLSRVASFMITEWKCYMNMKTLIGIDSDMHELTHGAGPLEAVSDSVAWIVKQWGKLVAKLQAMREADGSTLLDHSALVLLFEGGHGFDPEGNRSNSAHSTENMSALIAGRVGGLGAGRHVATRKAHPAQVVLSAMNAVGVRATALGDVRGNLPELFV